VISNGSKVRFRLPIDHVAATARSSQHAMLGRPVFALLEAPRMARLMFLALLIAAFFACGPLHA
jgi:hypothetical protein